MSDTFMDSGLGESGLGESGLGASEGDEWDDDLSDDFLLNETAFLAGLVEANDKFKRQMEGYINYHKSVINNETHVYPSAYLQNRSSYRKQAKKYEYDIETNVLIFTKKFRDGIGK